MIFVVVHKATVKDNFLFIIGKTLNVKSNALNASVCLNNLCGELLVAASNLLSNALNENVVAALIGECCVFCKSKGKNTLVYAV